MYFTEKNNLISFSDRREKNQSPSSSSTRSHRSNPSENGQSKDRKHRKKHQKDQRRQSESNNGQTKTTKKLKSLSQITDDLSQPPPPTTVESHFNPNEFIPSSVPTRPMRSPILNASSSSEIGFEEAQSNESRSTTPIPDEYLTRTNENRSRSETTDSILTDRPPARLENRHSPVTSSTGRHKKNKDDVDSFFED